MRFKQKRQTLVKLNDAVIPIVFFLTKKRLPLAVFETETAERSPAHCQRRHLGE